jgi:hypothetical protein
VQYFPVTYEDLTLKLLFLPTATCPTINYNFKGTETQITIKQRAYAIRQHLLQTIGAKKLGKL